MVEDIMTSDHSIVYGIVCDDVRREDNGKLIVIGMYASDIRLSVLPSHLILSFMIAVDSKKAGNVKFEALISLGDKELGRAEGELNLREGKSFISLPRLGFEIQEGGQFKLEARLGSDEWTELWRGPIGLPRKSPTSS
jgi:hypothetical protein